MESNARKTWAQTWKVEDETGLESCRLVLTAAVLCIEASANFGATNVGPSWETIVKVFYAMKESSSTGLRPTQLPTWITLRLLSVTWVTLRSPSPGRQRSRRAFARDRGRPPRAGMIAPRRE